MSVDSVARKETLRKHSNRATSRDVRSAVTRLPGRPTECKLFKYNDWMCLCQHLRKTLFLNLLQCAMQIRIDS